MRMWAFARYDLHLSEDEFYSITPRQFDALLRRDRHRVESHEFLIAQLTSVVMNTGFRSMDKPTKPTDYMPSEWTKARIASGQPAAVSTPARPARMTKKLRAEVANSLRSLFPLR